MTIETIDGKELRAICDEYEFNEDDAIFYTEKEYALRKALSTLEQADYIIFCLYLEYSSERKLASLLGCSRTPVNRAIKRIRKQILKEINGQRNTEGTPLTPRQDDRQDERGK